MFSQNGSAKANPMKAEANRPWMRKTSAQERFA
jgi:hypothetical protein